MKDVYDNDTQGHNSSREVLQSKKRAKCFYNTMRDIVERTYRCTFHLYYKNQSSDSNNQVIQKLQETFLEQWSIRSVRLATVKNYNVK